MSYAGRHEKVVPCGMIFSSIDDPQNSHVVVVAGSLEGLDALARLINQLSSSFPIPVVVQVHGLHEESITRLTSGRWRFSSKLEVVHAKDGDRICAGHVYMVRPEEGLVFTGCSVLGHATHALRSHDDDLFKSAALWHGAGVIGVVLSGLGKDGTAGLKAVADAKGICIVQSPTEAAFSGMPSSALLGGHVQHSVLLDQMGALLEASATQLDSTDTFPVGMQGEIKKLMSTSSVDRATSLDRSIINILAVIRKDLAMDIAFVSKEANDVVVVSHSTAAPGEAVVQGSSHPKEQSLCQHVLEGHLPAMVPSMKTLRMTHSMPVTTVTPGSYMAVPVWLLNGMLYGTLCCFNMEASPELDQRHFKRLQMSARQIARLVNEADEA